jgi:hypothetical protein
MGNARAGLGLALLLFACGGSEPSNAGADAGRDAADAAPGDATDAFVGDGARERPVYGSHESQYCSPSEDDDPFFVCSKSSELICIATYTKRYPQPSQAPDKVVTMWICRHGCTPGDGACAADEICCPGLTFGVTYGKSHACVLPEFCGPLPDAGVSP